MSPTEDDFRFASLGIAVACPRCGNEMTRDGNSLPLAESPNGACFECGSCSLITQWRVGADRRSVEQVPVEWGGTV